MSLSACPILINDFIRFMHKHTHPFLLMTILAMMSISGLIASDVFLPALPEMVSYFSLTPAQGQALFSLFLVSLAGMQLLYGPLSDQFGRRKLLLAGIGLFTLASLCIALATHFTHIALLRIFQAIGACAGITLARAIVGDLYSKEDAGKVFLAIFPVIGMSPAIAPMIGGWLYTQYGWRSCFLFTAGFAFVLLLLIWRFLPETHAPTKNVMISSWRQIFITYKTLLFHRPFLHYAAIPCFAYAAYFSFIVESPFLFEQQGVAPSVMGFSYISLSLTYVLGNLCARHTLKTNTLDTTLTLGYWFFFLGGLGIMAALNPQAESFLYSISAMSLLTFGNGFLLPLGTAGAITSAHHWRGAASGLMGFLQLSAAALATQLSGWFSQHQADQLSLFLCIITSTGFILFLGTSYRSRNTKHA